MFCKYLLAAVPDNATSQQHIVGFNEAVAKVQINFDLANPSVEQKTDKLLADIGDRYPDATPDMQLKACKTCISKLPSEPVNYQQIIYRTLDMTPRLITLDDFRFVWLAQLKMIREQIEALTLLDVHPRYGEYSRQIKVAVTLSTIPKKRKSEPAAPPQKLSCTGCGRGGHLVDTCRFTTSPFFNSTLRFLSQKAAEKW